MSITFFPEIFLSKHYKRPRSYEEINTCLLESERRLNIHSIHFTQIFACCSIIVVLQFLFTVSSSIASPYVSFTIAGYETNDTKIRTISICKHINCIVQLKNYQIRFFYFIFFILFCLDFLNYRYHSFYAFSYIPIILS